MPIFPHSDVIAIYQKGLFVEAKHDLEHRGYFTRERVRTHPIKVMRNIRPFSPCKYFDNILTTLYVIQYYLIYAEVVISWGCLMEAEWLLRLVLFNLLRLKAPWEIHWQINMPKITIWGTLSREHWTGSVDEWVPVFPVLNCLLVV